MEGDLKMTRKEIIDGLKVTVETFMFDLDKTAIDACNSAIELLKQEQKPILVDTEYYHDKYNHTMQQINKLAQMMHDNALMYQNLLDHNAQGKINPYADIERWMNMIFDEDFL